MWTVKDNINISMDEGDWGVELPIQVTGTTLTASDALRLSILDGRDGAAVITKEFSNVQNNAISLELTHAESQKLRPRSYVWRLDWYQSGSFHCNLINGASFKVVDGA